jgi:hypothetical protein
VSGGGLQHVGLPRFGVTVVFSSLAQKRLSDGKAARSAVMVSHLTGGVSGFRRVTTASRAFGVAKAAF